MNDRLAKLKGSDAPERRGIAVSDFEMRKAGDKLSLTGYASVFESKYDLYGGPLQGGWSEVVDRSAFEVTLREKPDLHLLINHEGLPLARTKSGTLMLSTDKIGLRVEAPDLDRRDPDVQRLEVKMDRGDLDEMSFAFRVKRDLWDDEIGERRLLEVSLHKGDVSVVNFGANPATSAELNSLLKDLSSANYDTVLAEARSMAPADLNTFHDLVVKLLREVAPKRNTMSVAEARKITEA